MDGWGFGLKLDGAHSNKKEDYFDVVESVRFGAGMKRRCVGPGEKRKPTSTSGYARKRGPGGAAIRAAAEHNIPVVTQALTAIFGDIQERVVALEHNHNCRAERSHCGIEVVSSVRAKVRQGERCELTIDEHPNIKV